MVAHMQPMSTANHPVLNFYISYLATNNSSYLHIRVKKQFFAGTKCDDAVFTKLFDEIKLMKFKI